VPLLVSTEPQISSTGTGLNAPAAFENHAALASSFARRRARASASSDFAAFAGSPVSPPGSST
jgi:hypothetical protein